MTQTTIPVPSKTLQKMYIHMGKMKKDYEILDHFMAQIDEMQGNVVKVSSTQELKYALGHHSH